ncbi:MAG: hypothetical protein NTZ83_06050, partial [Candidatus Pacearchaeota archaeon]|nr:hypothetical protein [Candidatus Pacearchaeota archaeon]
KIYDKEKFLRLEHRIKIPLDLDIMIEILNRSSNSIEIYNELCEARKERREIKKSYKYMANLLHALLKKHDEDAGYL